MFAEPLAQPAEVLKHLHAASAVNRRKALEDGTSNSTNPT